MIRVLALAVVAAMLAAMAVSALLTTAQGEAARDEYTLELDYLEDQQALRVRQRLLFTNRTGEALDRVLFSLYANQFRRATTVMYETQDALPAGFYPGGAELYSVTVNGEEADWAAQGEGEYFLRVACDLAPDETCEIGFIYDLLLTENAAFCGADADGWRLSGFYPTLCTYRDGIWEANQPLQHCRTTLTTPADYRVTVTLPERFDLSATGEISSEPAEGGTKWTVRGENLREFAFAFSRKWREARAITDLGTELIVQTSSRRADIALEYALEAANALEGWFGRLPAETVRLCETDLATDSLAFAGEIWLDESLFERKNDEELKYQIRFDLAQQFFGIGVYADPVADAWLCTSVCEYASYLLWEELDGRDAFLTRINARAVPALSVTIPGNRYITADATLFTQAQFDTVVRDRGAIALHELRTAMGREDFLDSLARYFAEHEGGGIVTEMDFLQAFNDTTGQDWEDFLTEILFHIDEYGSQSLEWYE